MDASVLRKRIYKLLIFSILMVLGILLMAFLFINHADDSLNKATYTTMDQEIDLCVQRVSSKKNTDLVLLNTFARNLNKETDLDSSLFEMNDTLLDEISAEIHKNAAFQLICLLIYIPKDFD